MSVHCHWSTDFTQKGLPGAMDPSRLGGGNETNTLGKAQMGCGPPAPNYEATY